MELTEKKQNKFTNWLLAIGLGAICGLMSIGASMINNAKKVNAYEYQDNGSLSYDVRADSFDYHLLYDWCGTLTYDTVVNQVPCSTAEFDLNRNDDNYFDVVYIGKQGSSYIFISSDNLIAMTLSSDYTFSPSTRSYQLTSLSTYDGYYDLLQFSYDYHQNVNQEGMQNILTYIVGLLTGGIVGLSSGIGLGTSTLVSDIFISNGVLSVFGGMIIVFASLSLAIGLCRWVMQFLTSLGAKK